MNFFKYFLILVSCFSFFFGPIFPIIVYFFTPFGQLSLLSCCVLIFFTFLVQFCSSPASFPSSSFAQSSSNHASLLLFPIPHCSHIHSILNPLKQEDLIKKTTSNFFSFFFTYRNDGVSVTFFVAAVPIPNFG